MYLLVSEFLVLPSPKRNLHYFIDSICFELLVHTLKYFCTYYSTVVVSTVVKVEFLKIFFRKEPIR